MQLVKVIFDLLKRSAQFIAEFAAHENRTECKKCLIESLYQFGIVGTVLLKWNKLRTNFEITWVELKVASIEYIGT